LLAFVVTNAVVRAVRLNGRGLVPEVEELRRVLADADADATSVISRAHARLIRPLEAHLHTPNVAIVPHGPLHYVPFNVLSEHGRPLFERFGIRLLPSASVLKFMAPTAAGRHPRMLVVGNPRLDAPDADLQHAEDEARQVARLFRGHAEVLIGGHATETAVRRRAPGVGYLHFATHGHFDSRQPLASSILLARDAEHDGRLTAADLYGLDLDADLVTLSACDTGLNRIGSGDEIVGLTRGFLFAGARSIVASLWKVDDLATAALMRSFYAAFALGDKRRALAEAQHATRLRYPHPFYWGAFQLIGQPD
jgi:CHAT domain-containing protein